MADENHGSDSTIGDRGRRPAPTIDLTATEVASEPLAEPAAPGESAREAEVHAEAADTIDAPPPPREPENSDHNGIRDGSAAPREDGVEAARPHASPWRLVGAAVLGGAVVLGLSALMSLTGWIGPARQDTSGTAARLAALELQVHDLAARPAPAPAAASPQPAAPAPDTTALADLSARLDKVEAALANPPAAAPAPARDDSALQHRLDSTDSAIKSLGESLAALKQRTESLASAEQQNRGEAADTGELAGRIAALESSTKALDQSMKQIPALDAAIKQLREDVQKDAQARTAAAHGLEAVRRALLAQSLNSAVDRGEPFGSELAAVKPLVADPKLLAALEPFAQSGVPSASALGHELVALVPAMRRTIGAAPAEGGILERLQASAERLVRVRRTEDAPGPDPSAVISRVELRAERADVAGALAEIAQLPPNARAPADAWVKKAEARKAALDAARRISAGATDSLKTSR